jgi:folate-dependent phosphoribosylglycinamide formyltransferase PurN/GNAT superfamily N-acetyltransferase
MRIHEELEALDARGVHMQRYVRTPERYLAWIDAEFGGWCSSDAFTGSSYIAEDARGPVGFAAFDVSGARGSLREDMGILGSFGVTPRARENGLGRVLLHGALFSLRERGYARALLRDVADERLAAYVSRHANASVAEEEAGDERLHRTVVLASGNGTNFQAVIDAVAEKQLPLELVALVANRPQAYALERARRGAIPATTLVWDRANASRTDFDARVMNAVAAAKPDLVLLLGWMHVLPPEFFERFPEVINIHPAFLPLDPALDTVTMPDGDILPALRGPRAIADGLALGMRWFGVSVHRVTPEVDRGRILVRAPLRREPGEGSDALTERIHALEHRCLVEGVARWASSSLEGGVS